jgi:hypothetical protein
LTNIILNSAIDVKNISVLILPKGERGALNRTPTLLGIFIVKLV